MEHALAVTQDPVSQGIVAAVIVAVFALLAMEKAHRVLVIFSAVALLWLITYFTPWHLITFEAAHQALDLNVLLLLASRSHAAVSSAARANGFPRTPTRSSASRASGDVQSLSSTRGIRTRTLSRTRPRVAQNR